MPVRPAGGWLWTEEPPSSGRPGSPSSVRCARPRNYRATSGGPSGGSSVGSSYPKTYFWFVAHFGRQSNEINGFNKDPWGPLEALGSTYMEPKDHFGIQL